MNNQDLIGYYELDIYFESPILDYLIEEDICLNCNKDFKERFKETQKIEINNNDNEETNLKSLILTFADLWINFDIKTDWIYISRFNKIINIIISNIYSDYYLDLRYLAILSRMLMWWIKYEIINTSKEWNVFLDKLVYGELEEDITVIYDRLIKYSLIKTNKILDKQREILKDNWINTKLIPNLNKKLKKMSFEECILKASLDGITWDVLKFKVNDIKLLEKNNILDKKYANFLKHTYIIRNFYFNPTFLVAILSVIYFNKRLFILFDHLSYKTIIIDEKNLEKLSEPNYLCINLNKTLNNIFCNSYSDNLITKNKEDFAKYQDKKEIIKKMIKDIENLALQIPSDNLIISATLKTNNMKEFTYIDKLVKYWKISYNKVNWRKTWTELKIKKDLKKILKSLKK